MELFKQLADLKQVQARSDAALNEAKAKWHASLAEQLIKDAGAYFSQNNFTVKVLPEGGIQAAYAGAFVVVKTTKPERRTKASFFVLVGASQKTWQLIIEPSLAQTATINAGRVDEIQEAKRVIEATNEAIERYIHGVNYKVRVVFGDYGPPNQGELCDGFPEALKAIMAKAVP